MTLSAIAALAAFVLVVLSMLAEQRVSLGHERRLLERGAVEPPSDVYRTMRWAYPTVFVAMALESAWIGGPAVIYMWVGSVLLLLAKVLKFWAIATLGERWTFRVLVPPGAERVVHGPYRFIPHPNYVAVVGEIVGFGILVVAPFSCAISLLGFGALLRRRIRIEERALGGG